MGKILGAIITALLLALGCAGKASAVDDGPSTSYRSSTSNSANPTPPAKPKRLTIKVKPRRVQFYPIRFKVSGKLFLPKGAPASAVCKGQKLKVKLTRGKHKVKTLRVRLKGNCKYSKKVVLHHLSGTGKLKVKAIFGGSARLLKASSRTVKVRFG